MSRDAESITVLLFALPRDLVGSDQAKVTVTRPLTAAHLKQLLSRHYPILNDCLASCRIVANHRYLADDQCVPEDVEVALIPPVSGG